MQAATGKVRISKGRLWTGRIMSAVPVLMLLFSAAMKLIHAPGLDQGFAHLGWPITLALPLGLLELACTVVYLIPRTAILGAILLTGYLGGAIATHVRLEESVIIHVLLGVLLWGGLYLREPRLHALIPLKSAEPEATNHNVG